MTTTISFRGLLALVTIFLTLQVQAQVSKKPVKPAQSPASRRATTITRTNNHQYLNIDVDSTVSPPKTVINYRSDSLYYMVLSGDKLTSLVVDGRPVASDSFYLFDGLVRQMLEQLKRDREQAERDRQQAERDREQAERDRQQADRDREQAQRDAKQSENDRQQAERDREQAEKDRRQADRDREQAMRDKEQAEKDSYQAVLEKKQAEHDRLQAERDREQGNRDRLQADKDRLQADRDREQARRDQGQAERDREQAVRDKEQAERDREQAVRDKKQAEEDRQLLNDLVTAVVKDGLAPDEKSVRSLILDEYVFVVNGNKQSEELLKKYKEKFIKKEGYSIRYHNANNNKTMSIGRTDQ